MSRPLLAIAAVCFSLGTGTAGAQSTPPSVPFRITDNSFFVEEAFNQEAGIFQNIFGITRIGSEWTATFTQEWPVGTQIHQFSYTVAWLDADGQNGSGDTLLNYRFQALMESPGRPAFSPRASLILPTGDANRGRGAGSAGLQVNLPFSKQAGDVYWHWNAGLTWVPRAKGLGADGEQRRASLASPFLAASAIYRVRPMVHLMMESVVVFDQAIAAVGTTRDTSIIVSPGVRAGWDVGDRQVVVGFALPTSWADGHDTGAFAYFSYELPFRK